MGSILIISNEPALAETLASELSEFAVSGVSFKDAAAYVHDKKFNVILIDGEFKDEASKAFADKESADIITLKRPVRLHELLYTIRDKLQTKTTSLTQEILLAPGYGFYPAERLIRAQDGLTSVTLTEKEVELLQCLIKNRETLLPRDALLKQVWGYSNDANTHTLETHIYRLRSKLKQVSDELDIISSEEGGYRIR